MAAGNAIARGALRYPRGANVTAVAIAGDFIYSGMQNGAMHGFGRSRFELADLRSECGTRGSGPVERFWVDPQDPRVALAALGAAPADPLRATAPAHVFTP